MLESGWKPQHEPIHHESQVNARVVCSRIPGTCRFWARLRLDQADSDRPGCTTIIGHADIHETALYLQDPITLKNLTFNLGIRGDIYAASPARAQAEPGSAPPTTSSGPIR